jgi:hypothetical protein
MRVAGGRQPSADVEELSNAQLADQEGHRRPKNRRFSAAAVRMVGKNSSTMTPDRDRVGSSLTAI